PGTADCRWQWRRPAICSTRGSCATTRKIQSGSAAIVLCCRPATARCSSTACSISPATTFRSTTSSNFASSAAKRPDIPSTGWPRASRQPPARSARASATGLAWRWRRSISKRASSARHLGLGNIVYLYDDNHVTIDGHTELSFDEDVCKRFDAYKWHTQVVEDANDLAALSKEVENGIAETGRPSLIRVRSIIGYGSPHKQGTSAAHSNPLGVEEVKLTKEFYRYPTEPPFFVPDDALAHFRECVERGEELERDWSAKFETYARKNSALAGEFQTALAKELPAGWDAELPVFTPKESLATRVSASQAEAAIGKKVWNLFGGSADLNESTFTDIKDGGDFERGHYEGRNPHFGIREHGM